MNARLFNFDDLAAHLGKKREWMVRNHGRLSREHGFPVAVPGLRNLWDPAAIEAWLARQRSEVPAASQPAASPDEGSDEHWAMLLDTRAAALGKQRAAA